MNNKRAVPDDERPPSPSHPDTFAKRCRELGLRLRTDTAGGSPEAHNQAIVAVAVGESSSSSSSEPESDASDLTERSYEQHGEDARFCESTFGGRFAFVELDDLLSRFVGPASAARFQQHVSDAQFDEKYGRSVLDCYRQQSAQDKFWMEALADKVATSQNASTAWEWQSGFAERTTDAAPAAKKPRLSDSNECSSTTKQPTYGAFLRGRNCPLTRSAGDTISPHLESIVVPAGFSKKRLRSSHQGNPVIVGGNHELHRAVRNACDALRQQPSRHSVLFLVFLGDERVQLCVGVVTRSVLLTALVEDAFGAGLSTTAALLHVLRTSDYHELGYMPIFDFAFADGDVVPTHVYVRAMDQAWAMDDSLP